MKRQAWAILPLGAAMLAPASAATIVIVNQNAVGVGFNDPTPALPVGGNPGTSLGEQRLILFQTAAREWAALLKSNLVIRVGAQFNTLACATNSAVLGSAGPSNFRTLSPVPPGAKASTFYPEDLAEALLNADKNAGAADINATFNSAIDTGCFGPNKLFWYGIDPTIAIPGNRVALFPTVLHELGHGLGFISLVCDDSAGCSGNNAAYGGYPSNILDIWSYFQANAGAPATTWNTFSNAQRISSFTSEGTAMDATDDLVWVGANVTADLPAFAPTNAGVDAGHMKLYAPGTVQQGSSVSHWTTAASSPNLLMEPNLSAGVFNQVDLTYSLFKDIGWSVFPRDEIFPDNFDAF
jgi:hypothetical protein